MPAGGRNTLSDALGACTSLGGVPSLDDATDTLVCTSLGGVPSLDDTEISGDIGTLGARSIPQHWLVVHLSAELNEPQMLPARWQFQLS